MNTRYAINPPFDIKIHDNCHGRVVTLTSKLSNHNIAMIRFTQDGLVLNGDSSFFENSHNWWTMLYIGPRWKKIFVPDDKCSGSTECPLEGLFASKRMLQYFMDYMLEENDVIEVSGSTLQRDEVYEKCLRNLGFRFTPEYNDCENILIHVKESFNVDNPERIVNDFNETVLNPKNAWAQLRLNGVRFPIIPTFDPDDYDYTHHTLIYEALVYIPCIVWTKIKMIGKWFKYKAEEIWCDIKTIFIKKNKRHRIHKYVQD